jgi:hypothetical protein
MMFGLIQQFLAFYLRTNGYLHEEQSERMMGMTCLVPSSRSLKSISVKNNICLENFQTSSNIFLE